MKYFDQIESLNCLGYEGKLLDENAFNEAIQEGFTSLAFREVIYWLTNEISIIGCMEERLTDFSDSNNFQIELSGFLKELKDCFEVLLTHENITDRMQTIESRILLIDLLSSELMALKMSMASNSTENKNVITIHESPTASILKDVAITLNMAKALESVAIDNLFTKINTQLDSVLKCNKDSGKRLGMPLFQPSKALTTEQWSKIEQIQKDLDEEYNLRRKMLVTRMDVTIQSFKWSNRTMGKEEEVSERLSAKHQMLDKLQIGGKRTDVVALLAARDTLAVIEKTSSANVRKHTKSKIQRHIMGQVPDRGGRAMEHQIPLPEMPSWQKRSAGGDGQRGRGSGRGHRGSGRGGGGNNYQNQGFPSQHYQEQPAHNPANQYSQRGHYRGGGGGIGVSGRGYHGSRVHGGWSQRGHDIQLNYDDYNPSNPYNRGRGGHHGGGNNTSYNR